MLEKLGIILYSVLSEHKLNEHVNYATWAQTILLDFPLQLLFSSLAFVHESPQRVLVTLSFNAILLSSGTVIEDEGQPDFCSLIVFAFLLGCFCVYVFP